MTAQLTSLFCRNYRKSKTLFTTLNKIICRSLEQRDRVNSCNIFLIVLKLCVVVKVKCVDIKLDCSSYCLLQVNSIKKGSVYTVTIGKISTCFELHKGARNSIKNNCNKRSVFKDHYGVKGKISKK